MRQEKDTDCVSSTLKDSHNQWLEAALKRPTTRDLKWTQSLAVGDKEFIEKTKKRLGDKASGRNKVESETGYELKETQAPYGSKEYPVYVENMFYWDYSGFNS